MKLIIGGAYQGKLSYAENELGVTSIYKCEGDTIDFNNSCVFGLEKFTLACVRSGVEAKEYFEMHHDEWQDCVLICEDISCGVVPIDADMRAWREMTGRLCTYLSREADEVIRVFCGLPQKLK